MGWHDDFSLQERQQMEEEERRKQREAEQAAQRKREAERDRHLHRLETDLRYRQLWEKRQEEAILMTKRREELAVRQKYEWTAQFAVEQEAKWPLLAQEDVTHEIQRSIDRNLSYWRYDGCFVLSGGGIWGNDWLHPHLECQQHFRSDPPHGRDTKMWKREPRDQIQSPWVPWGLFLLSPEQQEAVRVVLQRNNLVRDRACPDHPGQKCLQHQVVGIEVERTISWTKFRDHNRPITRVKMVMSRGYGFCPSFPRAPVHDLRILDPQRDVVRFLNREFTKGLLDNPFRRARIEEAAKKQAAIKQYWPDVKCNVLQRCDQAAKEILRRHRISPTKEEERRIRAFERSKCYLLMEKEIAQFLSEDPSSDRNRINRAS